MKKGNKRALYTNTLWLITQEQKNTFCVLRGDSLNFSASSASFCHFYSPSFSLSSYVCPHSLESVSCLSKKASAYPNPYLTALHMAWGPQALNFSRERLTSVHADAPGQPCDAGASTLHRTVQVLNILMVIQILFIYVYISSEICHQLLKHKGHYVKFAVLKLIKIMLSPVLLGWHP